MRLRWCWWWWYGEADDDDNDDDDGIDDADMRMGMNWEKFMWQQNIDVDDLVGDYIEH